MLRNDPKYGCRPQIRVPGTRTFTKARELGVTLRSDGCPKPGAPNIRVHIRVPGTRMLETGARHPNIGGIRILGAGARHPCVAQPCVGTWTFTWYVNLGLRFAVTGARKRVRFRQGGAVRER